VANLLIQHRRLTVGDGCRGHLSPTVVVQLDRLSEFRPVPSAAAVRTIRFLILCPSISYRGCAFLGKSFSSLSGQSLLVD
jgi:hypothetical protein